MPAAVQAQPARAPVAAMPQDVTAGTDDLYYLDLADGTVTRGDQLRRDPLTMRARRLGQNLFREIGRPTDQPAAVDEILLGPIDFSAGVTRAALFVETSTGYVAFFDQLGKGNLFGRIVTVIGRPFAPIASAGGNYALLMRHDDGGRTVGAYLYHAGGGRGLYLSDVNRLQVDATATSVSGFPRLAGQVCAVELQSSERTTGYLVADVADGSLRYLDLESIRELAVRDTEVGLFPTFMAEAGGPSRQRFTAAPLRDSGENTTHVLFVDVTTGDLAVLATFDDPARQPVWGKMRPNLYSVLGTRANAGARSVAAVPARAGNGSTRGVWLIDSLTRGVAWVDDAETPASATVRRVTVKR